MTTRKLSEIWIYPVKSLRGVRVPVAKVLRKGLRHDRRLMLIDGNNRFMTQRSFPGLALFQVQFEGKDNSDLTISHKGSTIELRADQPVIPTPIKTQVWDDDVVVLEVSQHHSDWFSNQVGTPCKLVSFPEDHSRPVDGQYQVNGEHVSLADGFPLLIIGQASLDDLNRRLAQPILMNRFRPNLVFSGGTSYEEDQWGRFTIGRNHFVGVKDCSRCATTTIDQETGIRGSEPLVTLATYRRKDNNVYFGRNVIALDEFEIREGDEIILD